MKRPDTGNLFLVTTQGPGKPITIGSFPVHGQLSPAEARNLAAWLLIFADLDSTDPDGEEFKGLRNAIEES